MEGKLVIFSAPSGAGKSTIVNELLNEDLRLEFSISAASRPMRPNEEEGVHYYFLSVENFKEKIESGEFVEWEEVYKDQYYGTLKSEINRIWESGSHVIFDVDVIGGMNIKKMYGEKALSVFVMPPSIEVLKERLIGRSTETDESLKKRLDKAEYELSFADEFDVQLVNDDLELAIDEAKALVFSFLEN